MLFCWVKSRRLVMVGLLAGWGLGGLVVHAQVLQGRESLPSFEVVTIKPLQDSNVAGTLGSRGDRLRLVMTAKMLVGYAYNMPSFSEARILGPGWIESQQYVVQAKIEESMFNAMQKMTAEQREQQQQLMLQSMLAERIKLKVHLEKRAMPMYALVVAKGGPKLTAVKDGGGGFWVVPKGPVFEMKVKATTADDLAAVLGRQPEVGGRTVVNRTGLPGSYDLTMRWTRETAVGAEGAGSSPEADAPFYFTAIQEQLGLRLMPTKGPVDFLIIDHIEMPSEN